MHGFEVGDEVLVNEGGKDTEGVVRSIQKKAKLIDVQIYDRKHEKHCLTVSVPPESVKLRKGKSRPPEKDEEPETEEAI